MSRTRNFPTSIIFKTTDLFSWNAIRSLGAFSTFHSPFFALSSIPATRNGASCIDVFDEHTLSGSSNEQWCAVRLNVFPREYLALFSIHDDIPRPICDILPWVELIHWPPASLALCGHIARLGGTGNELHVMRTYSPKTTTLSHLLEFLSSQGPLWTPPFKLTVPAAFHCTLIWRVKCATIDTYIDTFDMRLRAFRGHFWVNIMWSPIRSVIIRVITKFVNHGYYYRPTSDGKKSHYQLIISITISDFKCPITCKCPINALIGRFMDQSDSRKL